MEVIEAPMPFVKRKPYFTIDESQNE